ncbi:MAG: serine/threonine-protein kinase [Nannocystaceae bacterium]
MHASSDSAVRAREGVDPDTTLDATELGDEGSGPQGSGPVARERSESRLAPLQRGDAVGRYTVLSRLGAGGMGVVYVAYDPELDRNVALKLLHPSGRREQRARARLLREAQALAKLAHPNVVAVFDAGEHEGEVWLAMELIEGYTLRRWLELATPRWPERLRVLLDAGRGVAAAHAAGLVHRDLKPSNVMVGDDGRVRVMDFGLARTRSDSSVDSSSGSGSGSGSGPLASEPPVDAGGRGASPAPAQSLTGTHGVVGTPAYMAPEQWEGGVADVRADQFSWCVMAWEALYGQRPFGARATAVLTADRVLEPPRRPPGGRVPSWVRRALETGLARDPDRRWPSVDALLRAFDRRRSRRRWQWVTAGLSVIFVVGLVANLVRHVDRSQRRQACETEGKAVQALWPGRAEQLQAVLRGSSAAYVRHLESTVVPRLDEWAQQWQEVRTEVCEAARLDESIASEEYLRAEICLRIQRVGIATLIDLMVREDEGVLRRVPFMRSAMPDVAECRDPARLESLVMPEPTELLMLRSAPARWMQAAALQDAGRYDEALEQLQTLSELMARRWTPLTAQLRLLRGSILADAGRYDEAETELRETYFRAGSEGDTSVAATSAALLVRVVGAEQGRVDEGLTWAEHARMMLSRTDSDDGPQSLMLLDGEARLLQRRGDHAGARARLEQALQRRRSTLGADHPQVGVTLRSLAELAADRGAFDEAAALHREALQLLETRLGTDHPEVAKTLWGLATTVAEHDEEQARRLAERALGMMERSLGPSHP